MRRLGQSSRQLRPWLCVYTERERERKRERERETHTHTHIKAQNAICSGVSLTELFQKSDNSDRVGG